MKTMTKHQCAIIKAWLARVMAYTSSQIQIQNGELIPNPAYDPSKATRIYARHKAVIDRYTGESQ